MLRPRTFWVLNTVITAIACGLITQFALAQKAAVPTTHILLDLVTLTNGSKLEGLVLDDSPVGVRFMSIRRVPGRPTITLTSFFHANEVANIKKLSEVDRAALKKWLADFDENGSGERRRMDAVQLTAVEWLGKANGAKRYEADHFELVSSAPQEVTRRAAVRLEQIYVAFMRFLPPRYEMNEKDRIDKDEKLRRTTVLLAGDLDQYRELLNPSGGQVLNPAVFDPTSNRIICGTDLRRLGDELLRTRIHHLQQLAAADKTEKDLREMYKSSKPDLDRFLGAVNKERAKVATAERENDRTFDETTRRVFAMLYHEAFHSYVMNYVFPARTQVDVKAGKGTGELPRWLNEGMAQLFEHPIIEAGELRVETPDPDRLKRVHEWHAAKGRGKAAEHGLIPLRDLLRSGKPEFLAAHTTQQEASDRTYLTAWALAYYLTFERRVFGTKSLDRYLIVVNSGGDSLAAFKELVGQELPAFEADWHSYLSRLHADGTVAAKRTIEKK